MDVDVVVVVSGHSEAKSVAVVMLISLNYYTSLSNMRIVCRHSVASMADVEKCNVVHTYLVAQSWRDGRISTTHDGF